MTDHATPNLPSRDFETTSRFYAQFGFEQGWRDDGWMILKRGGLTLEFFPHPDVDPLTSNFTAPAYTVQGATHNNVGDALTALDTAITAAAGSAVTQADIEAGNATTLQSANDYTDQQIWNLNG